jgi:uncharacterized protein (TIGR02271 family)
LLDGPAADRQLYIPLHTVQEIRADGIYLDVDQIEAEERDRGRQPALSDEEPRETLSPDGAAPEWSDSPQDQTLELRGEELQTHKEVVQTGELGIRKEIIAEERTLEVPIQREEVVIERHPVEPRPAREEIGEGEVLRVPVWGEQVQVEKQPVVIEELHITKRVIEETEHVAATVRREEARLERAGEVAVSGDLAP